MCGGSAERGDGAVGVHGGAHGFPANCGSVRRYEGLESSMSLP
jgi:hypothetical protein